MLFLKIQVKPSIWICLWKTTAQRSPVWKMCTLYWWQIGNRTFSAQMILSDCTILLGVVSSLCTPSFIKVFFFFFNGIINLIHNSLFGDSSDEKIVILNGHLCLFVSRDGKETHQENLLNEDNHFRKRLEEKKIISKAKILLQIFPLSYNFHHCVRWISWQKFCVYSAKPWD